MVDARLTKYLNEAIAKGHSIDKLVPALIKEGWDPKKVEEAANSFKGGVKPVANNKSLSSTNTNKVSKAEPKKNKKEWKKEQKEKAKEAVESRKRPVGVLIVAILHWIIALGIVATAFLNIFVLEGFYGVFVSSIFTGGMIWALVGVSIVVALLPFFTGLGIFKGRNAWRIVAIVFGIIAVLGGIFSLMQPSISGGIGLGVSLFIFIYLIASKKCKEYFKEE